MQAHAILLGAQLAAAFALLLIGLVAAWSAASVAKRIGGTQIAFVGAVLVLAVLSAPTALVLTCLAASFAYLVVGVAILVRLQESYGGAETPEIDAADRQADTERSP